MTKLMAIVAVFLPGSPGPETTQNINVEMKKKLQWKCLNLDKLLNYDVLISFFFLNFFRPIHMVVYL